MISRLRGGRQEGEDGEEKNISNLIPRRLVRGHMALQLSAVGKRVVAQGAGEVLLVLLMAVLDVLLQRCQTLVAPVAVGAGQQLGEGIWRSRWQVCAGEEGCWGEERGKGKRAKRSANQWQLTGGLPRRGMGVISAICSSRLLSLPAPPQPADTVTHELIPIHFSFLFFLLLLPPGSRGGAVSDFKPLPSCCLSLKVNTEASGESVGPTAARSCQQGGPALRVREVTAAPRHRSISSSENVESTTRYIPFSSGPVASGVPRRDSSSGASG